MSDALAIGGRHHSILLGRQRHITRKKIAHYLSCLLQKCPVFLRRQLLKMLSGFQQLDHQFVPSCMNAHSRLGCPRFPSFTL